MQSDARSGLLAPRPHTPTELQQHTVSALRNILRPSCLCAQLIEDLRRELEHLQLFKLEAERTGRTRSSSSGLADFNSRTREVELEHEVKRLKQVPTQGRLC